ncbi:transcriptional regulator, XRE family [Pseudogulbenkiania sp. NH8B]|uniref:helix-turn-helix domain-containing protein n=1 Tax=Pseudogulbenkiania sp. (strain NH8B) TaxID=748280 RepID=UPI0002279A82|nr:helix-turn-helix transcriptional regulator [Pseudogulbenkiania sp. NH8B]BAK75796.1 transcriptional regulator, XRE family [Pseudogulbenkiania sp. NH8B]
MSALGDRIKTEREKRSWSQAALAQRAGVSQTTITDLERGASAATTKLIPIARALKVNPHWLETGQGQRAAPPQGDGRYVAADSLEELAEQLTAKGNDDIARLWQLILALKDKKP